MKAISFIIVTTLLSINIYALPVSFNGFQLNQNGANIELNWQTSSEFNNDYFAIERSVDSISFVQIGTVDGAGNSNAIVNYNFIDSTANINQIYYYRIKQVDFDAQFSYSIIEQYSPPLSLLKHDKLNFKYTFFPNPTNDIFILKVENIDEKINFILFDIEGKEVLKKIIKDNDTNINISQLPSGIYIFNLTANNNQLLATGKVLKK